MTFQQRYHSIADIPGLLDELTKRPILAEGRVRLPLHRQEELRRQNRELRHLLADSLVVENAVCSSIMSFPDEVFAEIFHWLIRIAPPEIGARIPRKRRGWMCCLWVCSRWRLILEADSVSWALAYTHLPQKMELVIERAKGRRLAYIVRPDIPLLPPSQNINTFSDNRRLERMQRDAKFARCSIIELNGRGDVLSHMESIRSLALLSEMDALVELRVRMPSLDDARLVRICRDLASGSSTWTLSLPELRMVHFMNCWFIVASKALEVLSLNFTQGQLARPSPYRLVETLLIPHAGTLRSIAITNAVRLTEADRIDGPFVFLERLAFIELAGVPKTVYALLSVIAFPSAATVRLRLGGVNDDSFVAGALEVATLIKLRRKFDSVCMQLYQEDDDTKFFVWRIAVGMKFTRASWIDTLRQNPALDLRLCLGTSAQPTWWMLFNAIIPPLKLQGIKYLVLDIDAKFFPLPRTTWDTLFRTVPDLQGLHPLDTVLTGIQFQEGQFDTLEQRLRSLIAL